MQHSNPTQNERILSYIEENGSITQLEALNDLGVMRLASRISDLKRKGYNIKSENVTVKNRYGEKCNIKRYSIGEMNSWVTVALPVGISLSLCPKVGAMQEIHLKVISYALNVTANTLN